VVDHLAFPDLGAVLFAFLDREAVFLPFPFPPWGPLGATP
jgi:hypothetical protein